MTKEVAFAPGEGGEAIDMSNGRDEGRGSHRQGGRKVDYGYRPDFRHERTKKSLAPHIFSPTARIPLLGVPASL